MDSVIAYCDSGKAILVRSEGSGRSHAQRCRRDDPIVTPSNTEYEVFVLREGSSRSGGDCKGLRTREQEGTSE